MTKSTETVVEKPFNDLPFLPPSKDKIETIKVLRQLVTASLALTITGSCRKYGSKTIGRNGYYLSCAG